MVPMKVTASEARSAKAMEMALVREPVRSLGAQSGSAWDWPSESVMATLMGRGFSYVGQIRSLPTTANEIIDDVYVNLSHIERYWGRASCAFAPPPARGADDAVLPKPPYEAFERQLKFMTSATRSCCSVPDEHCRSCARTCKCAVSELSKEYLPGLGV